MTALRRAWRRASLPRMAALAGTAVLLGAAAMSGGVLLGGGGLPLRNASPGEVAALALAAAVAALGVALPCGVLGGVADAGRAWAGSGAWRALRASGVAPGALVVEAALVAAAVAVPWAVAEHVAIPRARAALADAAAAVALPSPGDGRAVRLGSAWLAREGDGVRILMSPDGPDRTRVAAVRGEVVARPRGVALDLQDVAIDRRDGLRVAAARLRGVWAPPVRRGAGERPTDSFTPRDAYERWGVWKRTLLPASTCGWVPAALAAGMRGRVPAALVAVACMGAAWFVVRALDGVVRAGALGVPAAGAALLGVAVAVAAGGVRVLGRP